MTMQGTPTTEGVTPQVQPQAAAPPQAPAAPPVQQEPAEEVLKFSPAALKSRLERETKAQLHKTFGTDNVEDILAWKKERDEFAAEAEQRRLQEMSDLDRHKEMYAKAEARAAMAEARLAQTQEGYEMREQDRAVVTALARHVSPQYLEYASLELARALGQEDEGNLVDPDAYIEAWGKTFVASMPAFAIAQVAPPFQAAPPVAPPQAPPPRQVPINNGTAGGRPGQMPPPGQANAQKTAAPGRPNSMSETEFAAYRKARGYDF